MQLYCSFSPKECHLKFSQFRSRGRNCPCNTNSAACETDGASLLVKQSRHHTAAPREEKGTGGPCESGTEGPSRVLCPRGTPTKDRVFPVACLCFSSVLSECAHSGTSSAHPVFRNPKCQGLREHLTVGCEGCSPRACPPGPGPLGLWGLGLGFFGCFLFFSFRVSAGKMCNVSLGSDLTSLFQTLRCSTDHLKWEKCKVGFPFCL